MTPDEMARLKREGIAAAEQVLAENQAAIAGLPDGHPPIHIVDYTNGRDFRIECLDIWTSAEWKTSKTIGTCIKRVFRADSGDLYTFAKSLVTCPDCKAKARQDDNDDLIRLGRTVGK